MLDSDPYLVIKDGKLFWIQDAYTVTGNYPYSQKIKGIKFFGIEVDHVDHQLNHVLKIPGIDVILLDNMGQWQLKHAVEMRNEMCGKKPLLEASGNVTLNNVLAIAQCGVDRIAIGAITHSAAAADIALDR